MDYQFDSVQRQSFIIREGHDIPWICSERLNSSGEKGASDCLYCFIQMMICDPQNFQEFC